MRKTSRFHSQKNPDIEQACLTVLTKLLIAIQSKNTLPTEIDRELKLRVGSTSKILADLARGKGTDPKIVQKLFETLK